MSERKENLADINKHIFEIKKKIQLSEGQRKAHYEEWDGEKKRNDEKIKRLKKEIKELHVQLSNTEQNADSILKSSNKHLKQVGAVRYKSGEEIIELFDCKATDLKKKLDILRHESKKYQDRIKVLADEYHTLLHRNVVKSNTESPEVYTLENQIHRIEMNLMEAEYVRKKYRIIRASLLEDSVEFESSLVKIEEAIKKQEVEINRLRNIYGEALDLRDVTKGMLVRQEVNAINTAKAREKELQNLRRRVDERRLELDRLERQIFSTGRTLMHQDSVSSLEGAPSSTEDSITKITDALEETFDKLKAATGETEPEDVLKKFLSQKKTLSRLSYLRGITEGEKQELQKKKDFMIAELEAFKFAEVKDNEQNVEECEKAKQEIQDDVERRQKLDAQVQKMTQQLCDIRSILSSFCDQLKDASGILLLPDADILKVVETLENQIKNILDRIGEEDDPCKKMKQQKDNKTEDVIHPLENEQIISVKAAESKSSVLVSSETDDEEEVPTRGFLKRQAQIIVDAKSRRKQFPMGTRTKKILTIK